MPKCHVGPTIPGVISKLASVSFLHLGKIYFNGIGRKYGILPVKTSTYVSNPIIRSYCSQEERLILMPTPWRFNCSVFSEGAVNKMLVKIAEEQHSWSPSALGSGPDRRNQPRVEMSLSVTLVRPGQGFRVEAQTKDVSRDSFFCVSEHPFSPGETLDCEIILPGDDRTSVPEPESCLECRVRVVRVVTKGTEPGFGLACQLEDYPAKRTAAPFRG